MTTYNGWGLEALFGYYSRTSSDNTTTDKGNVLEEATVRDERAARFITPIWVKKNFRFPKLISPFVAAGVYLFDGRHVNETRDRYLGSILERTTRRGLYPTAGVGIEFFPARFFRPRIEVRQFWGPQITARGNAFRTNSTFYSLGVLTS